MNDSMVLYSVTVLQLQLRHCRFDFSNPILYLVAACRPIRRYPLLSRNK